MTEQTYIYAEFAPRDLPNLNPRHKKIHSDSKQISKRKVIHTPCELVESDMLPTLTNIDRLPIRKAAYVRNKLLNKIYYVNKTTVPPQLVPLDNVDARTLLLFDIAFNLSNPFKKSGFDSFTQSRKLSKEELNKILLLTGHNHRAVRKTIPRATEWQMKNGCDLIISHVKPTKAYLESLPISNAAYIRYKNKLYYANKKAWNFRFLSMSKIRVFKMSDERLARFDQELKTATSQHRKLTEKELSKIKTIIGHLHMTTWQKALAFFGYVCSSIIAVGSGVSTAGTFITMASGGLAGLIAAAFFITGTAVNWWIFKRYVPPVLIDLFGREKFMSDEDGKPLSPLKKFLMAVAVTLAASVGITFGALTFVSTFDLVAAFPFLVAISPAIPYIAGILAGVTVICMTAMMLKDIADLIKKKNVLQVCKNFIKDLFSTKPDISINQNKTPRRIFWERNLRVLMTFIFIPLACVGLFMTMNACAPGVKAILLDKIPGLSAQAAGVIANVISLGFAFIGQIGFGIKTAFETIFKIFSPKKAAKDQKPQSTAAKIWDGVKLANVGTNAVGNGFISGKGAGTNPAMIALAIASGTGNSAFAGGPAALDKHGLVQPLALPAKDDLYTQPKTAQPGLFAPHHNRSLRPLKFSPKLMENLKSRTGMFAREEKIDLAQPKEELVNLACLPMVHSSDDMARVFAQRQPAISA